MIVSEARISANRRNALRSTGPRTPEGKERSRANALKHGLCSNTVVAEDAQLVQKRAAEWYQALKPRNEFHCWLVDEISVISLQIDRAERMERRLRDRHAPRAELGWEDDRRMEAATLGGQLARKPEEVVEALSRTPQGCEWLMTRWAMLAHAADVKFGWTPDQARLAFDLLATPAEFREGHKPGASLDFRGNVVDPADDPAAVARRELDALTTRRDEVAGLDEVDRELAASDLSDEWNVELKRVRRYESALHRRLRWCLARLGEEPPNRRPNPDLRPGWVADPVPAPESKTEPEEPAASWRAVPPHPPFDLEPHECPPIGEEVDLPAILAGRRAKKMEKAESRRQGRRRKLERLRA